MAPDDKSIQTGDRQPGKADRLPSYSRQEDLTADYLFSHLVSRGIDAKRVFNNVWAVNEHFEAGKPTLLLCSHHDTVRPGIGYTRDPHTPAMEDGRLYGLGSNDAGAPLVALIEALPVFTPGRV